MTYPNYPQQQPQYPQQQPGYPPQYAPQQQPQYPPPQPAYPPQQQPAYQPPYAQQNLGIDDFYDQPAASGKSISSWFQTPGQSITGIIARAISKADIRPQTDMQTKQPLPPRADGSIRSTMSIPLLVQPSPDFPDGRAAWIVGPSDRPDLEMAMEAAGCKPKTVPEAGATITVTFVGFKQIPGFGVPKKLKSITYQRPAGSAPNPTGQTQSATAPAPGPAPATQVPPATAGYQGYTPQPQYAGTYAQPQQQAPAQYPPAVYPAGQAAQDMVTGNGAYAPQPLPQYAPPAQQVAPQAQYAPGQDPYAPPQQYQQQAPPTPGAASAPAASTPGAPPTAPASPSNGGQQYAVPSALTPEQEERLRQLTGQQ